MVRSRLQRQLLAILNDERHRGRWWTTRALTEAVYDVEHASQEQCNVVRASLRTLEKASEVVQSIGFFQHEWTSARHPAQQGETMLAQDVRTALDRMHVGNAEDNT